MSKLVTDLLVRAAAEVLACPDCGGTLAVDVAAPALVCKAGGHEYPVRDGVLQFLPSQAVTPELEHRRRVARHHANDDASTLLSVVGRHHSIPAMRYYVARLVHTFASGDWLLDLGAGWGWHWMFAPLTPFVLAVDLSHDNLVLARRLVRSSRVLFVCADATRLPVRTGTIAGVWTVQMLEHLPPRLCASAIAELARVMRADARLEYHGRNLGAADAFVRAVSALRHAGAVAQDALRPRRGTAKRLVCEWKHAGGEAGDITLSWSELLFHPSIGLRPVKYPLSLERMTALYAPFLARLLARQVRVSIR